MKGLVFLICFLISFKSKVTKSDSCNDCYFFLFDSKKNWSKSIYYNKTNNRDSLIIFLYKRQDTTFYFYSLPELKAVVKSKKSIDSLFRFINKIEIKSTQFYENNIAEKKLKILMPINSSEYVIHNIYMVNYTINKNNKLNIYFNRRNKNVDLSNEIIYKMDPKNILVDTLFLENLKAMDENKIYILRSISNNQNDNYRLYFSKSNGIIRIDYGGEYDYIKK